MGENIFIVSVFKSYLGDKQYQIKQFFFCKQYFYLFLEG